MEPMMLVSFLAIGFAVLLVVQAVRGRRHETSEEKVMKGYFLLGLSGLMAKIVMADGKVTSDETELAQRIFGGMKLTDAERSMCIGNFVTARREKLEARDHAKRFIAYANKAACAFLYDILWRLSRADGTVDIKEDELLCEIALDLGLDKAMYESFKAGQRPRYDAAALQAAGVPESLLQLAR